MENIISSEPILQTPGFKYYPERSFPIKNGSLSEELSDLQESIANRLQSIRERHFISPDGLQVIKGNQNKPIGFMVDVNLIKPVE